MTDVSIRHGFYGKVNTILLSNDIFNQTVKTVSLYHISQDGVSHIVLTASFKWYNESNYV